MGTDLKALMSQLAPNMKGSISGKADLKIRGSGETGRMSTVRGGGALSLTDGELSGFSFVEKAKKFTGGKPIRYKTVQATFTYMDGIFTLLPGSQAIAPDGDMLYRNVMVDGAINSEKELSFFALGKVNIRALNSVLGAFQGPSRASSAPAPTWPPARSTRKRRCRAFSAASYRASQRTNSSSSAWA